MPPRDLCPDCGALGFQGHANGCMTKAVIDGELTPRARQVMIVERRMALGIEQHEIAKSMATHEAIRVAIESGCAFHRDAVVRMHPDDIRRLRIELRPRALDATGSVRFEGHRIVEDASVPVGYIDVVPAKVQAIIDDAPASMNVKVGLDPAFKQSKPTFFMNGDPATRFTVPQPLGLIRGLSS